MEKNYRGASSTREAGETQGEYVWEFHKEEEKKSQMGGKI